MLENCGEQVNITIGLIVNNIIFKMGIIIVASQKCVRSIFLQNILCKTWKIWYWYISMGRILEYQYVYQWTNIDLSDIGSIDMQH